MTTCLFCGKEIPREIINRDHGRKFCDNDFECYRAHKSAKRRAEKIEARGGSHWKDPTECPDCHGMFVRTNTKQIRCLHCGNKRLYENELEAKKRKQAERYEKIKRLAELKKDGTHFGGADKIDYNPYLISKCACGMLYVTDGRWDSCPTCRGIITITTQTGLLSNKVTARRM